MNTLRPARIVRLFFAVALVLAIGMTATPPAQAIHVFPLTPVFDPLGHDCAKALSADPGTASGRFSVVGVDFVNDADQSSTVAIDAGETVTWTWLADHCHSVTFSDGSGTVGAPGFQPAQPQLVRMSGGGDASYSATFDTPGEYLFSCVHHGSIGMTGTVVVT